MSFDFQKLGADRMVQNVARAINKPTGTLFTGDITKGDVVVVDNFSGGVGTARVKARRTGALPLEFRDPSDDAHELSWYIEGTTLTVNMKSGNAGEGAIARFWVF